MHALHWHLHWCYIYGVTAPELSLKSAPATSGKNERTSLNASSALNIQQPLQPSIALGTLALS